jgi:hypothetical protein
MCNVVFIPVNLELSAECKSSMQDLQKIFKEYFVSSGLEQIVGLAKVEVILGFNTTVGICDLLWQKEAEVAYRER